MYSTIPSRCGGAFKTPRTPYADGVLQHFATGAAFVPVLWRYEVSAVLAKSQKDGILTALKADEFLASLNKLNIVVDPTVPIAS